VCALSRPLDDQSQARVRLEAEAVEHLLRAVGAGNLHWISSEVVRFEIARCLDDDRRAILRLLCQNATEHATLSDAATARARDLRSRGLRDLDALHLAVAELAAAEVLLTTDDRFIRAVRNLRPVSSVRVENPILFGAEVIE